MIASRSKDLSMALSRAHRREDTNFWPGFVDALSTMLIGIALFLLTVFDARPVLPVAES